MNILNFIVIDDSLRSKRIERGLYSHAVNGVCFISLGISVPVIQKGSGCVGLGIVTKLVITEDSTTIVFTVDDISDEKANAYYDLYRNQSTSSNDSDVYNQSDVIIPGMMSSLHSSRSSKKDNYKEKDRRRPKSLMDYDDDDCHWD